MEHNQIREDFQQFSLLITKFCPPKEPISSPKGGRSITYSNHLILTLGCLWLKNGKPVQKIFLSIVEHALNMEIPSQGCFSKRIRKLYRHSMWALRHIYDLQSHSQSQV